MGQPASQPQQSPGDIREDHAATVAAAIAAIFAALELALLGALAAMIRKAVTGGLLPSIAGRRLWQVTTAAIADAGRQADETLAGAMRDTGRLAGHAGDVPDLPALRSAIERAEQTAALEVQGTFSRAVRDTGEPANIFRAVKDAYHYAVRGAIEDTRGGLPASSLSLSRIQAAQKALDDLTAHGITGFTDTAGRRWDLASYVEMATRTAVSNAWDDLQNSAQIRAGHDLILTYTQSTEGSCPRCLPWLGRILSLTGAATGAVRVLDSAGQPFTGTVHATLADARRAGFRHPSCRCSWLPVRDGMDLYQVTQFAEPPSRSAETYKASQEQRALERRVRAAGRRSQAAITPAARRDARRELAAARAASAAHKRATGLRMTQVGVKRREHPSRAH